MCRRFIASWGITLCHHPFAHEPGMGCITEALARPHLTMAPHRPCTLAPPNHVAPIRTGSLNPSLAQLNPDWRGCVRRGPPGRNHNMPFSLADFHPPVLYNDLQRPCVPARHPSDQPSPPPSPPTRTMIFDMSRDILNARLGRVPTKVHHLPSFPPTPSLITIFQDRDEKSRRSRDVVSVIGAEDVRDASHILSHTRSYQSSAEPSGAQEDEQASEGIQLRESRHIQLRKP